MPEDMGKIIRFPTGRRAQARRRGTSAYTLRVYLVEGPYGEREVGREIYRTLKLRGDQRLEDLHQAILSSYERPDGLGYEFFIGSDPFDVGCLRWSRREMAPRGGRRGRERPEGVVILSPETRLESLHLQEDQFFGYRFDPVEQWIHIIQVLSVDRADPAEAYPLLLEKTGNAPAAGSAGPGPEAGDLWEEDLLLLLIGDLQVNWRKQVENRPLRPQTRLATALRKLPTHWLEAICRQVGLGKLSPRAHAVEALSGWLPRKESLRSIWSRLPLPSRDLLRWILEQGGGWVRGQDLSRRYGPDPDITWWWNEGQLPETPLGLLRLHGLAYVGRYRHGGRRVKIVSVPVELRDGLRSILADPWSGRWPADAEEPDRDGGLTQGPGTADPDPWKGLEALNLRSFLSVCPFRKDTEGLYTQALGRIRRNPEGFPKRYVRELLRRMTQGSSVWSRLEAYKLGLVFLDERFVALALTDGSARIREWAQAVLADPQGTLF